MPRFRCHAFFSVGPVTLAQTTPPHPGGPVPFWHGRSTLRAAQPPPPPASDKGGAHLRQTLALRRPGWGRPGGACSLTPRAEILIYVARARAADNNDGSGGARRCSLLDEALLITLPPPPCRRGTVRGEYRCYNSWEEEGADGTR